MKNYNEILSVCNQLLDHPIASKAKEYLHSRISSPEILKEFGYFPNNSNLSILTNYIDESKLVENSLLYYKYIDDSICYRKIRNLTLEHHNLIMPYYDVYGNIVSLVGRSLLSDVERKELNIDKYKNTSFEKRNHLFGLNYAKKSIVDKDCVYVVEGQFDQLKCREFGISNVVAVGSCNLSYQQLALLIRYTKNIKIMFDNDDGGKLGNQRIKNKFSDYKFNFSFVNVPNGYKDIDEFLKDGGKDYFDSLK